MPNTIIGKIMAVGQTQRIPTKSGGELLKREVVLDASRYDEYTGEKRENYPSFTFMSKNVAALDGFQMGDVVEISFIVSGRRYEKDGKVKYINDIVGYKIEARKKAEQPSEVAQAPVASAPKPTAEEPDMPF